MNNKETVSQYFMRNVNKKMQGEPLVDVTAGS